MSWPDRFHFIISSLETHLELINISFTYGLNYPPVIGALRGFQPLHACVCVVCYLKRFGNERL